MWTRRQKKTVGMTTGELLKAVRVVIDWFSVIELSSPERLGCCLVLNKRAKN